MGTRRAAPGALRALWRDLRLAARRLCRQIRRRRRWFGGVPGAEAARQGEAAQPYCNNKPAAGASEGTGTATALPPSLLCACPEHSRKWCPRQHRGAHGGPHPNWSGLPQATAPVRGKPEVGTQEAGAAGSGAWCLGFCQGPKFQALEVVVGCSIPEGDVPPLLPKMRYSECLGSALLPSSPGLSAQAACLRPREQSQQGGQWLLPATPPGGQPQLCLVHLQVRLLPGQGLGDGGYWV